MLHFFHTVFQIMFFVSLVCIVVAYAFATSLKKSDALFVLLLLWDSLANGWIIVPDVDIFFNGMCCVLWFVKVSPLGLYAE